MPYVKPEVTLTEDELKGKSDEELAELIGPYTSQERAKKILTQAITEGKLPDMRDPVVVGTVTWGRVMVPGFEEQVKEATKRVGTGGGGQKTTPISVAGVVGGEVEITVPDTDKELLSKAKAKDASEKIAEGTTKKSKPKKEKEVA